VPELPEVETVVRGLRPLIIGRRIVDYDTRQPKALNLPIDTLRARGCQSIRAVDRRGKSAVLRLETADLWLHLGLEGQALYDPPGTPGSEAKPVVSISLDDGARLRLERIFMGHAHLLEADASAARAAGLGVDPLERRDPDWLRELAARKPGLGCKAALMDQGLIAGVGNVYSDEALHLARLHPARKLGTLSPDEIERLWSSVRDVLADSVKRGGDESYTDVAGRRGTFASRVHGRKDCLTCGGPTLKQSFGGRGAYLCPSCQGSPALE
jgi:formamidopyrimidine-DNA glycosylase